MRLLAKIRNSRLYRDNRGSAMIVAIVVSIIVIAFSLSLLLVSYSLFTSNTKRITQTQVKELAKSVSLEIGDELTTPGFESKEEFIAGINNTAEAKYPCSDYNLWYYIRYNLFQNNWLSYKDETSAGHVQANAYRYFTLDVSGGDVTQYATWADEVSVCMYWECEAEDVKDEATLTIIVTVTKGDQKAVVTSYYTLNVDNFPDSDEGETINDRTDSAFNPTGNSIYLSENWRWTKVN